MLNFEEGELPFKYLELPIKTSKLSTYNCKPLVEKIFGCIKSWRCRFLPYVGRLFLIKSILFNVQVYWSSIFMFPLKIQQLIYFSLQAFLWDGSNLNSKRTKVAWNKVCMPLDERGLGIMRSVDWNKTALMKHIWNNQTL